MDCFVMPFYITDIIDEEINHTSKKVKKSESRTDNETDNLTIELVDNIKDKINEYLQDGLKQDKDRITVCIVSKSYSSRRSDYSYLSFINDKKFTGEFVFNVLTGAFSRIISHVPFLKITNRISFGFSESSTDYFIEIDIKKFKALKKREKCSSSCN